MTIPHIASRKNPDADALAGRESGDSPQVGRIEFGPEHKDRPSLGALVRDLRNVAWPDRLVAANLEAREAEAEPQWHILTEQEIDDYTVAWGVPRTVAEMCLNLEQLESASARHVSLENLGLLAQKIEEYGQQRFKDGEMAERERYQEAGE